MAWIPTVDVRSASRAERRRPGQAVVALLLVVTFLPALARWLWIVGALLVAVGVVALASWRGTRDRLARWRERRMLRKDPRGHRAVGTVRVIDGDRALCFDGSTARVAPFALESDAGRLVLVDATLGFVSSRLRELRVGDRVAVLGPRAEVPLDFVLPERRSYRGSGAPLALGGRLDAPIFVEPG